MVFKLLGIFDFTNRIIEGVEGSSKLMISNHF